MLHDDVLLALENLESNSRAIEDICSRYGVYGGLYYYTPSEFEDSDLNGFYVVAGTDPGITPDKLPDYINPEAVIRRNSRNEYLFYTDLWAMKMKPDGSNFFQLSQKLTDYYCKGAEAVRALYGEHNCPVPKKLRISELNMLINVNEQMHASNVPEYTRGQYQQDLAKHFKKEKSKSTEWMDFYRSDKFPDNGNIIQKVRAFQKRNEQVIDYDLLKRFSESVSKINMQEHEYKIFKNFMENAYPDVTFAVDDVHLVDHKLRNTPNDPAGTPTYITGEDFDKIRNEHFAKQSFACLRDYKVTSWNFRDVYYREVDEPIVAAVINDIRSRYAKCDQMDEVYKLGGELKHYTIPAENFSNFVSMAKANKLKFFIDNRGMFFTPKLEEYHVIYNEVQEELVQNIVKRMFFENVEYNHAVEEHQRKGQRLDIIIDNVKDDFSAKDVSGKEQQYYYHEPGL